MPGVVPVLVLGIHDVTVVASARFVTHVGGRVRHPDEDAQGSHPRQHGNSQKDLIDHDVPTHILYNKKSPLTMIFVKFHTGVVINPGYV
jgi:hypothetical protein